MNRIAVICEDRRDWVRFVDDAIYKSLQDSKVFVYSRLQHKIIIDSQMSYLFGVWDFVQIQGMRPDSFILTEHHDKGIQWEKIWERLKYLQPTKLPLYDWV